MSLSVLHALNCNIPDAPDSELDPNAVRPSDWNAEHVLLQSAAGFLGATGAGATGLLSSAQALSVFPQGTAGYALMGNGASAPSYQGFLQSGTGAVTRTWLGKAQECISVLDFIPVNLHAGIAARTDVTDLQPYIMDAIAYVDSRGGGTVYFPAGDYNIFSPIIINYNNIFLEGAGRGSENGALPGVTNIWYNGSSAPAMIAFGDGITPYVGGGLKKMRIDAGQGTTSVLLLDTVTWTKHEYITVMEPASGGYALKLNSADIANPSNNCGNNSFMFSSFVAQTPGSSGIALIIEDTVVVASERGGSRNSWYACDIGWSNDSATAYGIQLGHCDSNIWTLCDIIPNSGQTAGYSIFGGPCNRAIFPGANVFYHCFPESNDFARIFGGTFGTQRNTFFGWDDQVTIQDKAGLVFYTDQGKTWIDGDLVSLRRVANDELAIDIAGAAVVDFTTATTSIYTADIIQNKSANAPITTTVYNPNTGGSSAAQQRFISGSAADLSIKASHPNLACFIGTLQGDLWVGTSPDKTLYLFTHDARRVQIDNAGVAMSPFANDGIALGTAALSWSDLFGASGFTLNLANSDWVATHTSGILTVGTGDLRITTAGTNAASVVTVGGTQELTNKTLTSAVGKGTWTASGTWTLPAFTLGGTVSGGGQQLNNIIIGTSTPLAGAFTTLSATGTLTYGGVTLSAAVTGTGNMVLSASPTITGTMNISSLLSSGDLTCGSGSGTRLVELNGANSGSSGGAWIGVRNGGTAIVAFGNYSAVQGGAYDATPYLYANAPLKIDHSFLPYTNNNRDCGGSSNFWATGYFTNLRFGTFSSNADAAITGYVTITDAAGNSRKLATIA